MPGGMPMLPGGGRPTGWPGGGGPERQGHIIRRSQVQKIRGGYVTSQFTGS